MQNATDTNGIELVNKFQQLTIHWNAETQTIEAVDAKDIKNLGMVIALLTLALDDAKLQYEMQKVQAHQLKAQQQMKAEMMRQKLKF